MSCRSRSVALGNENAIPNLPGEGITDVCAYDSNVTRKADGKFLNKKSVNAKRKSPSKRVPGGYPQIADPKYRAAYEWQRNFVYGWFFEMLEKLKSDKAKAAHRAIEALEGPFLAITSTLLTLAKGGKDKITKQWAGRLLGSIGCSIGKYDKKLFAANRNYRKEKAKFGELRLDVLFPRRISRIVQRELRKAERMRRRLLVIKKVCGRQWTEVATRQRILKAYWLTLKLPDFSEKSWPQWWEFLWPIIRKKINVAKLDSRYQMARKRYASDSDKTARGHLKLLAHLRGKGVLL